TKSQIQPRGTAFLPASPSRAKRTVSPTDRTRPSRQSCFGLPRCLTARLAPPAHAAPPLSGRHPSAWVRLGYLGGPDSSGALRHSTRQHPSCCLTLGILGVRPGRVSP